ncbi:hypothetical protein [Cyanobium sp. NS01]|nr:hypothetical protein [Cyanobium sp. NS01]
MPDFLERYVDARSNRLASLASFEAIAGSSRSVSTGPWSRDALT